MSALAVVEPRDVSGSLYDLAGDLQCLLDTADMVDEGTADRAELDAQIAQFGEALPKKVDATCRAFAYLESQAAMAKAEASRLTKRQKHFESQIEQLEQYCIRVLETLPEPTKGNRKLEGQINTLTLKVPSERCKIDDETMLPIEYKTVTAKMPAELWRQIVDTLWAETLEQIAVDVSVRLVDVKKALKEGAEIDGADIEYVKGVRRS